MKRDQTGANSVISQNNAGFARTVAITYY